MHVLVTRPDPATAVEWRARGMKVTVAPLLAIAATAWEPPAVMPGAVAFTSASGVACAGPGAMRFAALPVFAVGRATADAASAGGWRDVRDGGGTAATLFARVAAGGVATVLHLAGADRVAVAMPPGLTVVVRTVYAAAVMPLSAEAVAALASGAIDAVPLFSPRTAAHFAAEVDRAFIPRARIRIAVLSPAVAAAAGPGWGGLAVAAAPTGDALFAATRALCDKAATSREGQ